MSAAIRGDEWVARIAQGLNVVKVSVVDVRVEHEVKLIDFTKGLERAGGSPREVSDRHWIRSILGMLVARSDGGLVFKRCRSVLVVRYSGNHEAALGSARPSEERRHPRSCGHKRDKAETRFPPITRIPCGDEIRTSALLQLRVLGLGLLQDGNAGVGILPEREKILVSSERPDTGGICIRTLGTLRLQNIRAGQAEMCQCSGPAVPNDPAMVQDFLKLRSSRIALSHVQIGRTAQVSWIETGNIGDERDLLLRQSFGCSSVPLLPDR
jgi:hypothetical protein